MEGLISCKELRDQIQGGQLAKNVIILDVSWASSKDMEEDYKSAHIPGARYINVMDAKHDDYFPRNIPEPDKFQEKARAVGVNDDSHLILYSNSEFGGYFLSGRAWWTFKVYGHNHVSILDGGWKKWAKEGGKTENGVPSVIPGNFTVKLNEEYRLKFEVVMDNFNENKREVCDSRAVGKVKDGHIKGAKNLPLNNLIDEDNGVLKSVDDIKKEFNAVGIDLGKPLTTYCTSGMSSCSLLFAAILCGGQGALYHGGFSEWSKRASQDVIEK